MCYVELNYPTSEYEVDVTTVDGVRAPRGDWTGTPYLSLVRQGPFATLTVDRPDSRNAMTNAMYYGVRYASSVVDGDPDLAGLLITGTGDVSAFASSELVWEVPSISLSSARSSSSRFPL